LGKEAKCAITIDMVHATLRRANVIATHPNPRDEVRSLDAQRLREQHERKLQTNLDLGRLIRFKATYSPAQGAWNLFLACLGAAILIAVIAVNLI